jgi:uncharacterized protein
MNMKSRTLTKAIKKALKTFPAIVVTGPRQSGKTTLLKELFGHSHQYLSLENPDIRIRAKEDPISFLEQYQPPMILDEIQYVPELLSYIKTKIDLDRKPGQWLFTGSQNFKLMNRISQSLAGRAAILSLLPLSLFEKSNRGNEAPHSKKWIQSVSTHQPITTRLKVDNELLRGSYPEIALHPKVDRQLWCNSYIATYLDRDVRQLSQIGDLTQFERFLKLCAIRTGQILNLSDMASSIGISVSTAKRWISILEASYQIYLLCPYYQNIGKRLIKSPKLYFADTGLASFLMGIHSKETLLNSPNFGDLFETMVVTELLKMFTHHGHMPSIYYLRTLDKLEVDVVMEIDQKLHLFEIKSGATINKHHASSLLKMTSEKKPKIESAFVISRAPDHFLLQKNIANLNWSILS